MARRAASPGQVLVLFALFLLALLGISALAIELRELARRRRNLQNVADHAALAGASAICPTHSQGPAAAARPGQMQAARAQAMDVINADLGSARRDRDQSAVPVGLAAPA